MMKRILLVHMMIFLIFGALPAFSAEEIPVSFSGYHMTSYKAGGKLYLSPEIVSKKTTGKDQLAGYEIISFTIKNNTYGVVFDPGPSEDPNFIIHRFNNGWNEMGATAGYRLFISASGNVYSDALINHYFNVRRKYKLTSSGFEEVKQALLLVDNDCTTSSLVKIRAGENINSEVIAILPKGNPIKIIASKFYFSGDDMYKEIESDAGYPFLVSTAFGLVGWVNVKAGYIDRPGIPVDCIRFMGD
jgi:hypothetical protein